MIYSGIGLRMSSLHSLAGEWEADTDKPVYNQNSVSNDTLTLSDLASESLKFSPPRSQARLFSQQLYDLLFMLIDHKS